MVSDVFWTGLFTFGGGLVGAAAGLLTARLQLKGQEGRLGLDKHSQESDERHQRQERNDQLRTQRQVLYLRYVGAFDSLHTQLNGPEITSEELLDIWSAMMKVDSEVDLIGGEVVGGAADRAKEYFAHLISELDKIVRDPSSDWERDAPALRKPDAMGKEMHEVRDELIKQMRLDLQEE